MNQRFRTVVPKNTKLSRNKSILNSPTNKPLVDAKKRKPVPRNKFMTPLKKIRRIENLISKGKVQLNLHRDTKAFEYFKQAGKELKRFVNKNTEKSKKTKKYIKK